MEQNTNYRFYGWGKSFPLNAQAKQIKKEVSSVAVGENHMFIMTSSGELLAKGSNKFGQLGISKALASQTYYEDFIDLSYYPNFKAILGEKNSLKIKEIACGAEHTFIINQKNQVYSMGLNIKGQLGHNNFENSEHPKLVVSLLPFGIRNPKSLNPSLTKNNKPVIVEILEKFELQVKMEDEPLQLLLMMGHDEYVEKISCGALSTVVLTNKGRLLGCGFQGISLGFCSTTNKQHDDVIQRAKFCEILIDNKIERIHCGLSGATALSKEGFVYVWGRFGKLVYNVPKRIKIIANNKQISGKEEDRFSMAWVGDQFIAVLSNRGQVYTCGQNIDNQLGCESEQTVFRVQFQRLTNIPLMKNIYVGRNHCFGVTGDNQLYGWGSNRYNQIGVSENYPIIMKPTNLGIKLPSDSKIYPSSYFTLLLSSEKVIFSNSSLSPQKTTKDTQQIIPLIEYKKLLHDYQALKSLNLTLLERNHPPKKLTIAVQTTSKFDPDGVVSTSKFRQFQSNVEIDWNQLQLIQRMNQGGYGVIYMAKWREIKVVVKKFKIDNGDVSLRDFLSQCNAMEAVRHPNIVMFLGAVTKPKNYSIILEYCQKGSLWSYLQNMDNDISWDQRKRLAKEIAQGVHYLHSCKPPILHRDLKSLNIFLDQHYRIKIGDFGWTKTLDDYMTNKIGTYQWMAPEVIGNKPYTEKADVFSYSIILWEIASREPPYRNISGSNVSEAVLRNQLRPNVPKKTPDPFVKLMKKCWEHDPVKRPTFKQVIRELQIMKL